MPITPFIENPESVSAQDAENTGSMKTSTFDHLRQGVSVRNRRDFFDGVLPKFNFIFDDLTLEKSYFGDPKPWFDGVAFADVPRQLPEHAGDESQAAFHPGDVDASLHEPYAKSGIIEVFDIRDSIARKFIFERKSTGARGVLQDGNVDSTDASSRIVEVEDYAYPSSTPFVDGQEEFGLPLPGYIADNHTLVSPFLDHLVDPTNVHEANRHGADMALVAVGLYMNSSGSFVGDGPGVSHPGFGETPLSNGFHYAANKSYKKPEDNTKDIPRQDSLAFGDMQDFTHRGFIRQLDNSAPTRPNTLRLNDERRMGKLLPAYDDTITTIFTSSVIMDVGRGIESTAENFEDTTSVSPTSGTTRLYPYVGQLSYDVFKGSAYDPEMEAFGSAVKGIADNWLIHRAHSLQQSLYTAFDETRLFDNPAQLFYLTGTASTTAEGFTRPVRDKTQFVIEMPAPVKEVMFATSTVGDMHSGLVYYNHTLNRWETVGDLSSGPGLDYLAPSPTTRGGSMLAFTPSAMTTQTSSVSFLNAGTLTTDAGFPFATKFDATSSFTLRMEDFITQPFLLEKCVVEMDLEFSPAIGLTSSMAPRVRQFFILNQFDAPGPDVTINLAGENSTTGSVTHVVNKLKDVVAVGNITIADPADTDFSFHQRDLTIARTEAEVQAGFSGSWNLPFSAGVYPVIGENDTDPAECAQWRQVRGGDRIAEKNVFGGVNNTLLTSERSLVKGVPVVLSSSRVPIVNGITEFIPSQSYMPAPYMLLPDDSLVFGFANQSISTSAVYDADSIAEEDVRIGACRLRMIGSLVKEDKEHHEGLNQELIYEAINEDIGECTVDQFLLATKLLYSGTYLDDIVEGSMADGDRGIIDSHVSAAGCRSASLSYWSNHVDSSEYVYDSLLPNPADYHAANGFGFFAIGANKAMVVGMPGYAYSSVEIDTTWHRAFPFEQRYSSLQRELFGQLDALIDDAPVKYMYVSGTKDWMDHANPAVNALGMIETDVGASPLSEAQSPQAVNAWLKFYFGTGRRFHMVEGKVVYEGGTGQQFRPRPRGSKYGTFNATPQRSRASFRPDKYGQFRDMLEQRKYTRVFDRSESQLLGASVVTIFSSTLDQSSNRDVYATSSLPYFDGVARN